MTKNVFDFFLKKRHFTAHVQHPNADERAMLNFNSDILNKNEHMMVID